jgi:hypothetical protein
MRSGERWERAASAVAVSGSATKGGVALLAIPLLALFLIHPLIVHGCSCGHDFDFHLVSWFEAATQIGHGNLHPHWAFTPAWDAGEPRFVFYPPLSWYLGALLGMMSTHLPGFSETAAWTAVPIVFTWTALTLSGLTMWRLARRFTGANAALLAAAVYMANPYMLFTAYERTAYGELLAAAWMPLLFEGIFAERITVSRIAIPVALLWLTNAPAAVMGCYALALLALVRFALEWKHPSIMSISSSAAKTACGVILGLALAAFYIVPAAYELQYVQAAMATIGGMKIDANFLFEHTGATPDDLLHDQVLRTASWIAVALLAATAAALFAVPLRNHTKRREPSTSVHPPFPIAPLAALTVAIAFLLTPLSAPLWHHLPEMSFLQFPWRLLGLVAPLVAPAIAAALSKRTDNASHVRAQPFSTAAIFAALIMVAALGLPAWHLFRQACDPDDTVSARLALFHSNAGTDPTDEYTPITADNDALKPGDPAMWLADSPTAGPPLQTAPTATRTAPVHKMINAPRAEFLILNLRAYPSWRITLSQQGIAPKPMSGEAARADGLIAIAVPAGRSVIDIRYVEATDQILGDAISATALAALLWFAFARRKRTPVAADADAV